MSNILVYRRIQLRTLELLEKHRIYMIQYQPIDNLD